MRIKGYFLGSYLRSITMSSATMSPKVSTLFADGAIQEGEYPFFKSDLAMGE